MKRSRKKLRVAMFFSSDPSRAGGVQEHVYFLSRELRERGHEVSIFGPETKPLLPFKNYSCVGLTLQLAALPNGNLIFVNISKDKKIKLSKLVNSEDYDLCHIHEPYVPFLSWELIRGAKMAKVVSFHTAWNDDSVINIINSFVPFFKKSFSSYVGGAIFVSEIVKKRWQPMCARKVFQRIILNGVDHSCFFPAKKAERKGIELLFLGRLVKRKGLIYLLKALSILVKKLPQTRLVVVGDGERRKRLEDFVFNNNLSKNAIFMGEITGKRRVKYYQDADIFCAPYTDEGFGLTVIEAMACGCPIVGFKNKAFRETLKDYPAPELLAKQKDVGGLARALRKVIINDKLRRRLQDWCIRESRKFSWQKNARETEKLYYQVLSRDR